METDITPTVELHFPVQGNRLPSDHAYFLYSAISKLVPVIHEVSWLGIHTFAGALDGVGSIHLLPNAHLKIRLPLDKVPQMYELAGKNISIGASHLVLGAPTITALQPETSLWSRLVLIKCKGSEGKYAESESFQVAVQRQIAKHEIDGVVRLERTIKSGSSDMYARRVLNIKSTVLTGYGLYIDGLKEQDSLKLQAVGIGGKRKMGCGLFIPARWN
jgi:CRISPR-associated protein Cas6